MKELYFVDDNFISKVRYTKELLRAMIPLRESGKLGGWSAETTLNVAGDEELLVERNETTSRKDETMPNDKECPCPVCAPSS